MFFSKYEDYKKKPQDLSGFFPHIRAFFYQIVFIFYVVTIFLLQSAISIHMLVFIYPALNFDIASIFSRCNSLIPLKRTDKYIGIHITTPLSDHFYGIVIVCQQFFRLLQPDRLDIIRNIDPPLLLIALR